MEKQHRLPDLPAQLLRQPLADVLRVDGIHRVLVLCNFSGQAQDLH